MNPALTSWGYRTLLIITAGMALPILCIAALATASYFGTRAGMSWLAILTLPIWPFGHWYLARKFARTYPVRYEGWQADTLFKTLTSLAGLVLFILLAVGIWLLGPDKVASLLASR